MECCLTKAADTQPTCVVQQCWPTKVCKKLAIILRCPTVLVGVYERVHFCWPTCGKSYAVMVWLRKHHGGVDRWCDNQIISLCWKHECLYDISSADYRWIFLQNLQSI